MVFDDPLRSLHRKRGERHRVEVIQGLDGATLLRYRNDCGVFSQLWDCTTGHETLEQKLKNALLLLSTVPQGAATDVVWPRCCVHFGLFEGSHHILCVKGEGRVSWFGHCCRVLGAVVRLKSGEEGVEVIRE